MGPMAPPAVPARRAAVLAQPAPLDARAEANARQKELILRLSTWKLKQHLEYLKDSAKAA